MSYHRHILRQRRRLGMSLEARRAPTSIDRARHACYVIVEDDFLQEHPLVIKDVGPWDRYPTITNDAEHVVGELVRQGRLPAGRRLHYIDSDGRMDRLVVEDGVFVGFAPVAPPADTNEEDLR